MFVAPALRNRHAGVRSASARALHALVRIRGGEDCLREELHDHPHLSSAARAAAFVCLDAGAPCAMRTPLVPWPSPVTDLTSPAVSKTMRDRGLRVSSSQPRRLRFSPHAERSSPKGDLAPSSSTPDLRRRPASADARPPLSVGRDASAVVVSAFGCGRCVNASHERLLTRTSSPSTNVVATAGLTSDPTVSHTHPVTAVQELEDELAAWNAELANSGEAWNVEGAQSMETVCSAWLKRLSDFPARLEAALIKQGGPEAAPLIPAVLSFCGLLVQRGTALTTPAAAGPREMLLGAVLTVARAARAALTTPVLRQLCSTAAVVCFRAMLHMLAQLQQLSRDGLAVAREASAPLLLELPPMLASIIDHLDPQVQLAAWVRVAGEVLAEEGNVPGAAWGKDAPMRGWALRFCARCVDRCVPMLASSGGSDLPAWEVLSELTGLYERQRVCVACADHDTWRCSLEGAALVVAKLRPAQAREFLLLAACTGRLLPASLRERLAAEAGD